MDRMSKQLHALTNRVGRDQATRNTKKKQTALMMQSDRARAVASGATIDEQTDYAITAAALMALDDRQERPIIGAGGEVVPQGNAQLRDTLATPGVVACDASAERLRLLGQVGVDATAMALDTKPLIASLKACAENKGTTNEHHTD